MSAQKSALDESLYQLLEKGRERKTTPGDSCNVPRYSTTGRSNMYPISLPNRATTDERKSQYQVETTVSLPFTSNWPSPFPNSPFSKRLQHSILNVT